MLISYCLRTYFKVYFKIISTIRIPYCLRTKLVRKFINVKFKFTFIVRCPFQEQSGLLLWSSSTEKQIKSVSWYPKPRSNLLRLAVHSFSHNNNYPTLCVSIERPQK